MTNSMSSVIEYPLSLYLPISGLSKRYKLIKLANGLLCLLISDPSEKTASCALSVATGAFNDPDNVLGLAHLCEHMILAGGSKKNTSPQEFHDELSKNSGSINAYTSGQQTTFYFHMPNSSMLRSTNDYKEILPFEKLLEMFASYFEAPLFKKSVITKEIYAINNEHFGNKVNNGKMLFHGTRLLANANHPFHRFATGNITTLKNLAHMEKINLQDELNKYFEDHFFANNNMTLCLKGSQSLNVLTKLATQHFSSIKSEPMSKDKKLFSKFKKPSKETNCTKNMDFNVLKTVWNSKIGSARLFQTCESEKSNLVCIATKKSSILRVIFPVFHKDFPHYTDKNFIKNYNYWIDIVGDESMKSFDDFLKSNGFGTESSTYWSNFAVANDGLILQMKLSKKGWENSDAIMECFFYNYFTNVLSDVEGLAKALSENNSIDILKFLYQDITSSSVECSTLCADVLTKNFLSHVQPDALLKSTPFINSLSDSYNESSSSAKNWRNEAEDFIEFFKKIITGGNAKYVALGEPKTCGLTKGTQIKLDSDVYFEFSYFKTSFTVSRKMMMTTAFKFEFPLDNVFLPQVARKTAIVKQALEASRQQGSDSFMNLVMSSSINHTKPKKIGENARYQYWIKDESHDNIFKSKSILSLELTSFDLQPSPLNTMFLEILFEVMSFTMTPELYAAVKVGYSCSMTPSPRGDVKVKISIGGFSDGLVKIVSYIISVLQDLKKTPVSKELFRKARVNVRTKYEDAASGNCFQLSTIGLYISLEKYVWSLEDRLDSLEEDINIKSFQDFTISFLNNMYLLVLHHGDLGDSSSAINKHLSDNLTHHLQCKNTLVQKVLPKTIVLERGKSYVVEQSGSDNDPNNAITYFLQTGHRCNSAVFTLTIFTEFIFSLTLVPDLRHKRQVGYVVTGGVRTMTDTCGLQISCMSSSSPAYLEKSIEDYLIDLEVNLQEDCNEEKFYENYVQEFLKIVESSIELGKIEDTACGASDILNEVQPNYELGTGNGSLIGSQYKFHNKLFNTISLGRNNFQFLNSDEPIDIKMLRKLKLSNYLKFFHSYISVSSLERSKISIHITSAMDENDKNLKMMAIQLEAFMKMKGFNIPSTKIKEIVEKNGTNTSALMKDLYSYFSSQGESMRFILTGLKEIVKALGANFKLGGGNETSSSTQGIKRTNNLTATAVASKRVTEANYFRNVCNASTA